MTTPALLFRAFLALALATLCSACATPQRMPATVIHARVLDAGTDEPVVGATVDLRYVPPRGAAQVAVVTTTNATGDARLDVPAKWLSSEFGAAFFAGGYWRQIAVTAPGYDDGGFSEGPSHGRFERQLNLLHLDRTPPPERNVFGMLRSLRNDPHPTKLHQIITTFELADGPQAGATVGIPMTEMLREWAAPGKKFYLRRPFDEVVAWYASHGADGIRFDELIRVHIKDEPYEPADSNAAANE